MLWTMLHGAGYITVCMLTYVCAYASGKVICLACLQTNSGNIPSMTDESNNSSGHDSPAEDVLAGEPDRGEPSWEPVPSGSTCPGRGFTGPPARSGLISSRDSRVMPHSRNLHTYIHIFTHTQGTRVLLIAECVTSRFHTHVLHSH